MGGVGGHPVNNHINIISIIMMDWCSASQSEIFLLWESGDTRNYLELSSIPPGSAPLQPEAVWSSQDHHLLNVAVLTTGSRRYSFETATVKNQ